MLKGFFGILHEFFKIVNGLLTTSILSAILGVFGAVFDNGFFGILNGLIISLHIIVNGLFKIIKGSLTISMLSAMLGVFGAIFVEG